MKAIVLTEPIDAKDIVLTEYPIPKTRDGWVLIRVKAFGLNHSEQILRRYEIRAAYIPKPIIPGIECVGEIADASDSSFCVGDKVVALMGGMGRSFHGSYAEYVLVPSDHVFSVVGSSTLSWEQLAAVPETYFTAWGSLFECLQLKAIDTLLVRGATCALGYAVIQLAKALGCKVLATTHRENKLALLKRAGADEAFVDIGTLKGKLFGTTKVLELVGPKTLVDTMHSAERGTIICQTGVLGSIYHLKDFDPIKDIPNGVFLTGFYSNTPTQIVMDAIFDFLNRYQLYPGIGKVYPFSQIATACEDMDAGKVNGKIIITMDNAFL